MLCQVCATVPRRYKCPSCLVAYCSVACFKEHRQVCQKADSPASPAAADTDLAVEDPANPGKTCAPVRTQNQSTMLAVDMPEPAFPSNEDIDEDNRLAEDALRQLLLDRDLRISLENDPRLRAILEEVVRTDVPSKAPTLDALWQSDAEPFTFFAEKCHAILDRYRSSM